MELANIRIHDDDQTVDQFEKVRSETDSDTSTETASRNYPRRMVKTLPTKTDVSVTIFAYASRHSMRTAWNTATKHAGLTGLRPHDLRHTYATWMRQYAKLDLKGIMDAGGWASVASVVRYAHVAPSEAAEAADKLPGVGG